MDLNSFTHQEYTYFIATYHVNHIYLKQSAYASCYIILSNSFYQRVCGNNHYCITTIY